MDSLGRRAITYLGASTLNRDSGRVVLFPSNLGGARFGCIYALGYEVDCRNIEIKNSTIINKPRDAHNETRRTRDLVVYSSAEVDP